MQDVIAEFRGEYRWLSNFWPSPVSYDGVTYACVENAYQAAKTTPDHRDIFNRVSPGGAKRLSRTVPIRGDWDQVRVAVMRGLLTQKFAYGSTLGDRLMATGDVPIEEGNTWGDRFWGVCQGSGENQLGRLLMELRQALWLESVGLG